MEGAERTRTPRPSVEAGRSFTEVLRLPEKRELMTDDDAWSAYRRLKPGKSAYADLVWTHAGPSEKAKYLQVSPTGSNSHSIAAFDNDVDGGALSVTAWPAQLPGAS
ncbi:DUF4232 domain-containing protein [Streptomyces tubercidicus]